MENRVTASDCLRPACVGQQIGDGEGERLHGSAPPAGEHGAHVRFAGGERTVVRTR